MDVNMWKRKKKENLKEKKREGNENVRGRPR
jgi:hypothetical protein